MVFEKVQQLVSNIPHMTVSQAQEMTNIILEEKPTSILELGFCHGVSTCYMAAALEELGRGDITTIDLLEAKEFSPNINELLEKCNLSNFVTPHFEHTSYNWKLLKLLEESPLKQFDLCYIDGAHDWFADGFAFYLVDKLLKPGGLIVFDDLDWTYQSSPSLKNTPFVQNMPIDQRETPQIRKVYELLVKTHPSYDEFKEQGEWAYARKKKDLKIGSSDVKTETIYKEVHTGLGALVEKILRKLFNKNGN